MRACVRLGKIFFGGDVTEQSCWQCRYSVGANQSSVRRYMLLGYRDEHTDERRGVSIVCERRRIVNSKPCREWEREPGSDDE